MKPMLGQRIPTLCALLAGLAAAGATLAEESPPSWTESLTFAGDLRLRYEMIREDGSEDVNRARFRGRAGVSADLAENVRLVFGLATGGDDPVSTNQTFGDGFTTKDIGVDLAFVSWAFRDDWSLTAGKMHRPWFRAGGTSLVWDSDLTPEGLLVAYQGNRIFGSAGSFIVAERPDAAESRLNTLQAGIDLPFSEKSSVAVALAYFDYTNTIGQAPFYDNDAQGNTVDVNGDYVFDYDEIEFGAQYQTRMGAWPVTLFGVYLMNTEVSREDTAYTFGLQVGEAKKPRSMQFGYAWHDTGADALNATYNDSDLADGQVDATGHYFRARYSLREKIHLNGSFIFSEYGKFTNSETGFDRIMLDVQFEF
jgi:hypothetical protein